MEFLQQIKPVIEIVRHDATLRENGGHILIDPEEYVVIRENYQKIEELTKSKLLQLKMGLPFQLENGKIYTFIQKGIS